MSSLPHTSRSLWIESKGKAVLRQSPLPSLQSGQVLVQTLFSGVSRGTESLVFSGRVPPPVAENMRAPHQEGHFPWPVKYGYSNVGRVLEGAEELKGRSVFCLYPHQDFFIVGADSVTPLPTGLPEERAVLAANLETALNAVWDAELRAGDTVTVVGGGVVGALVGYLAGQYPGTTVQLVDIDPSRLALAKTLGLDFALPAQARSGADVVFHASGASEGLTTCLRLAGLEARIIELSWYGDHEVTVPLGEAFHASRLRIIGSQVGRIPAAQSARWTFARRLRKALELCAAPVLDALISGESSFAQMPEVLPSLMAGDALCHRIRYD